MSGIIVINKEKDMTSFDVIRRARRILNTKHIGHTGTLDPNATGVLVLCVDEATKLVPFLESDSKTYYAEIILGISTDSYDITGNVLNKQDVSNLTVSEIDNVLSSFVGSYLQYPPIYSSIKVNGKKLYEYARLNQEVEIKPRKISINKLIWDKKISITDNLIKFNILVDVSKGTYIRSLAVDIGKRLNVSSCMGDLKRVRAGKFKIEDAYTLKDLEENHYKVIEMLDALDFPILKIEELDLFKQIDNGMKIKKDLFLNHLDGFYENISLTYANKLKAIYTYDEKEDLYRVARLWK